MEKVFAAIEEAQVYSEELGHDLNPFHLETTSNGTTDFVASECKKCDFKVYFDPYNRPIKLVYTYNFENTCQPITNKGKRLYYQARKEQLVKTTQIKEALDTPIDEFVDITQLGVIGIKPQKFTQIVKKIKNEKAKRQRTLKPLLLAYFNTNHNSLP